jgi:hypothetical protein
MSVFFRRLSICARAVRHAYAGPLRFSLSAFFITAFDVLL